MSEKMGRRNIFLKNFERKAVKFGFSALPVSAP
jgi:hypothetical protein